jgi:hypothetical protein
MTTLSVLRLIVGLIASYINAFSNLLKQTEGSLQHDSFLLSSSKLTN